MAKRPTRPDMDNLVTSLEDGDLAYLTLGEVRALKRRASRGEKSRGRRSSMNSSNLVDRALQDIAAEISELAYPDDA